jgi:hypothetical protein
MLTRTLALATALSLALAVSGPAFASSDTQSCDTAGDCGAQSGDRASIDSRSQDPVASDAGSNDSRDPSKDSAKDAASRDASTDTGKDSGRNDAGSHDRGKGHK